MFMNSDPHDVSSAPADNRIPSAPPSDDPFAPLCAQIELFERAAGFAGRPRERLVALGEAEELYFLLYPHHYRALQTIRVASQLGKVIGDRQDPTTRCESRLLAILMHVITDAVQEGDLKLQGGQEPGELAFTIWALSFGTRALMDTAVATRQLGVVDGFRVSRQMTELPLEAIGWRPLLGAWDYARSRQRIRQELFAEEWSRLQSQPTSDSESERR